MEEYITSIPLIEIEINQLRNEKEKLERECTNDEN